jgi:hypothetical protein
MFNFERNVVSPHGFGLNETRYQIPTLLPAMCI